MERRKNKINPYLDYRKGKISISEFINSYASRYDLAELNLAWSVVTSRDSNSLVIEQTKKRELIEGYNYLIKKVNSIKLRSQRPLKKDLLVSLNEGLQVLSGNFSQELNYFMAKAFNAEHKLKIGLFA